MKRYLSVFILAVIMGLCINPVIVYAQAAQNSNETAIFPDYKPQASVEKPEAAGAFLGSLAKLLVFLVIIIFLIYLTVHLLKIALPKYKSIYSPPQGTLKILDSLHFGPNKAIYLVSISDKRLLVLGVSDKEINFLDKIEDAEQLGNILAQEKKYSDIHSFKEHLNLAQKKRRIQELLSNYVRNLSESLRKAAKRV